MAIPLSIRRFVESRGIPYLPIHHRAAFTAQEEAAAAHVPGKEWAKTVVCMVDGSPVLVLLQAHDRINLDALRQTTGARDVRLATEREFGDLYPECETGAMAPFGPLYGQPVYVDEPLTRDTDIAFHAGTHVDAIRMAFRDFVSLVHPISGRLSHRSYH
jgi:Ala-tRNA(Pro) deacylase